MILTESLITTEAEPDPVAETAEPPQAMAASVLSELRDVVFKLRAFMEAQEGDLGLGIELGMQRAADMIDNVIARHDPSDQGD